ncbi:MAG: 50S ribosomal protein L10 [Clostridiales bacterium]|nr:50S ribosomal protein L10 [Clostridiales bacterium]
MPSEKILKQKQQVVAELADKLSRAKAGVFVDYRGITVAQDTKLRADMRKGGVDYAVVKNTMTRFAAEKVGMEGLDEILNGTTALALSFDDPVSPAKILSEYAKKHDNFKIKLGFVEGKVISPAEVGALAALPPREVLIGMVLGTMNAPIAGLATVLNGTIRSLALALNAIAEKQS